MYKLRKTWKFKKDFKKYLFNKNNQIELKKVLNILIRWEKLPKKYKDHSLKWDYLWTREYHIKPDFLLIYRIDNWELELLLIRLWSHSELF